MVGFLIVKNFSLKEGNDFNMHFIDELLKSKRIFNSA